MKKNLFGISILAVLGIIVSSIIFASFKNEWGEKFLGFNVAFFIAPSFLFYISKSFTVVENNEKALYQSLIVGTAVKELEHGTGLVITPPGFIKVRTVSTEIFSLNIPGKRDEIFYGSDHETLPAGMTRPTRIVTGSHDHINEVYEAFKKYFNDANYWENPGTSLQIKTEFESFENDPSSFLSLPQETEENGTVLKSTLVIGLEAAARIRIKHVKYFDRNIGTVESAKEQLKNTVIKVINEIFSKLTPLTIIKNTSELNRWMVHVLQAIVNGNGELEGGIRKDSWGIVIEELDILTLDLSKKLSEAIRDARMATYLAHTEKVKGKALNSVSADKIKTEGKANAQAESSLEEAMLKAQAAGLSEMKSKLSLDDPLEVLRLQSLLQSFKSEKAHIYMGMDGYGDLMSKIQTLFNNQNKKGGTK